MEPPETVGMVKRSAMGFLVDLTRLQLRLDEIHQNGRVVYA